jgi:hypothetical protein
MLLNVADDVRRREKRRTSLDSLVTSAATTIFDRMKPAENYFAPAFFITSAMVTGAPPRRLLSSAASMNA